ncbi:hypothetical protein TI39_contig594g00028 [Zymoseptoria brevis]|uniref:Piwi domain-containing protein n=1 Tax=Zymoseptoria brevis TaxID=1047168 RepID=A0A0F4GI32_9PEZI|nr:hypothetical protein TI39_contig594g00028 [Zymoseptoria brevis]
MSTNVWTQPSPWTRADMIANAPTFTPVGAGAFPCATSPVKNGAGRGGSVVDGMANLHFGGAPKFGEVQVKEGEFRQASSQGGRRAGNGGGQHGGQGGGYGYGNGGGNSGGPNTHGGNGNGSYGQQAHGGSGGDRRGGPAGGGGGRPLPTRSAPLAVPATDPMQTDTEKVISDVKEHAAKIAKKNHSGISLINNSHGLRTEFAKGGKSCKIATNYLAMPKLPENMYVYSIRMLRPQGFAIKRRADKKLVFDRHCLTIPELARLPKRWVTDYSNIWSTEDLFNSTITTTPVRTLTTGIMNYENECGVTLPISRVEISYVDTINPRESVVQQFHVAGAVTNNNTRPALLLRGLNAFLTESARQPQQNPQQNFTFTSGSKAFDPATSTPLGPTLSTLAGFFLSARPGIDRLLLNINTATSAFFNRQTVQALLTTQPYDRLSREQRRGLIKGLKVRIMYSPAVPWTNRAEYRFIQDIHHLPASQHTWNGAQTINNFYNNISSQGHPFYPSTAVNVMPAAFSILVSTSSGNLAAATQQWFPANLLQIVENQRFGGLLEGTQTGAMVTAARMQPMVQAARILGQGLGMFGLNNQQPQGPLARVGLETGDRLLEIDGTWLNPPTVRYLAPGNAVRLANRPVQSASWNLQGTGFVIGSSITDLFYLNLTGLPDNNVGVQNVLTRTEQALYTHRVLVPGSVAPFAPVFQPQGSDLLNFQNPHYNNTNNIAPINPPLSPYEVRVLNVLDPIVQNHRWPIVYVLLKDKSQDQYAFIKRVAELRLGLQTVFVVCNRERLSRFDAQSASNIALKFNLRGFGVNHKLGDNDLKAIKAQGTVNTIVLGADVTHPPNNASPGTPSIAAVVGSTDEDFMHFPGSMRLQRSKQEDIVELGDMVKERLIDFQRVHGHLPTRVLFYRDGVSESQYDKVRTYEIPQIQKAFNWAAEFLAWEAKNPDSTGTLDAERNPWPPLTAVPQGQPSERDLDFDEKDVPTDYEIEDNTGLNTPFELTYIVVGKRHNTRFYPLDDKDCVQKRDGRKNDNVKPGLVVDQVITHPFSSDFYLQSHDPIIGTGKSAHYFVLQNGMGLSTAELHSTTHDFCYAYARATKGVSYCAPAYYADRLCDRARAYLRHWLKCYPGFRASRGRFTQATATQPVESFEDYNHFVKRELRDRQHWRPSSGHGEMKYGSERRNPWNADMDDTMFYL